MDFQNQNLQAARREPQEQGGMNRIPVRGAASNPARYPVEHYFAKDLRQQPEVGHEQIHQPKTDTVEKPRRIVRILDGFITVCLSAIFFGVPLFFTNLSLQGISFEKQVFFYFWLLLALVAWVSKGVIMGEMNIRRTPLDIPVLIFWAVYGLAIIFSVDKWHSFWGFFGDPSRGFMSVTALVIAYYLIVSHFNRKRFILMGSFLLAADFLLALWSLLLMMGINFIPEKFSQFALLNLVGSLTGLGIFLGAMLPLIVTFIFGLDLKDKNGKLNAANVSALAFLLVTLLINIFILLVLYSFVSWLGVLIGVSFFLVYILAQIVRPIGNRSWISMFVFAAILAILMIGSNNLARVQLPVEVSQSYQLSWSVAKDSLKNNFLIGSGPATYGYDFSLYKPQSFNQNPYYNIRFFQGAGIFFESLSTIGVIGSIAIILVVLTFLGVGVYLLSIDKKRNKLYSLGIFSAALVILVDVFAGKAEGSIVIIGTLVCALAIAMLLHESESQENYLTLSLKASPKYALALAFVFMVVSAGVVFLFIFVGKIYAADLRAGSAMREKKITQDGSVKKLLGAIAWNNKESRYYTFLGQHLMALANEETLKGEKDRNLNLIQDYLNSSISAVSQSKALAPKDVVAVEALAQIYENSGLYVADSFALAEDNYKKALELEPHNPTYLVKLGQIKLAQASSKKTEEEAKSTVREAKEYFKKAIAEKNNFAIGYFQLALAQEALGELDDAVKSIEQAAILEQSNLNYVYNTARIHQVRGNDDDNKIAEAIYKNIISRNEKEINTRFSLGLLYEKTKKRTDAANEYRKVLELLPAESGDVRVRIEKMLSNIANGIENKPENLKLDSDVQAVEAVSAPPVASENMPAPVEGGNIPVVPTQVNP